MRILYLAHRIPFPPDKGDKIRSYHWLRALAERHEVHLIALCDDPADLAHRGVLEELCATVSLHELGRTRARLGALRSLVTGAPLSTGWFDHPGVRAAVDARVEDGVDVALAFSSSMAPYLDRHPALPKVMDMVDVDSAKFRDYARREGGLKSLVHGLEGRRLGRYEEELVRRWGAVVLCTEPESELLRGRVRGGRIVAIRNGAALPALEETRGDRLEPRLLFVGAMDYLANVDAVEYAAHEIMPRILERRPDARFDIVGRGPAPRVRALDGMPGVKVHGAVADLAPFLRDSRLSLVPLRVAQGIQNKVLEAMAWCLPVVTSRKLGPSLGAAEGREILLADSPEEYAAHALSLLDDGERARAMGERAREFVAANFAWERSYRALEDLLADVVAAGAKR